MRLVYPHDYNGDTCGDEDSANAENVAGKMRIYYPRLAEDAMNIALKSSDSTLAENIEAAKLYGICVPKCPAPGEIVCKPHSQGLSEPHAATVGPSPLTTPMHRGPLR